MNHKILSLNELQNESINNSEILKPQYYISFKDKPSQEMSKELKMINLKNKNEKKEKEEKISVIEDEDEEVSEINSFLTPPKYYSSYKMYIK